MLDEYGAAAMFACAIERGMVTLNDLDLEEWQWALAYMEGVEERFELKRQQNSPGAMTGSAYSPEELLERLK